MSTLAGGAAHETLARAYATLGRSSERVYDMVVSAISRHHPGGGVLYDIGYGDGQLLRRLEKHFDRRIGVDIAHYAGVPVDSEFVEANLEAGTIPLPAHSGDVVTAVETIEHIENPRAFVRQLVRPDRARVPIVVRDHRLQRVGAAAAQRATLPRVRGAPVAARALRQRDAGRPGAA